MPLLLLRGLAKGVGMGAGMAGGQRLVDNLFGARNGNQQQPQQNQQVHCPFCNCFNANTQRFCGTCGKDMYTPQPAMNVQPAIPQPQAGSGAICPSCGYVNEQGKKFCNSCGVSLVPPVASTTPPPPAPVPYTHHENPSTVGDTIQCICGHSNPIGGKFCLECGAKCEFK